MSFDVIDCYSNHIIASDILGARVASRMLGERGKLGENTAKPRGEWGKEDLKSVGWYFLAAYASRCRGLHLSWPFRRLRKLYIHAWTIPPATQTNILDIRLLENHFK